MILLLLKLYHFLFYDLFSNSTLHDNDIVYSSDISILYAYHIIGFVFACMLGENLCLKLI